MCIRDSPDLGATSAGDTASGSYTSSPVAPGDWFADPAEIGPFPPGGAPPESSSMDATARTQAFDPAITTAAGDLWTQSVDPAAPLGVFTIGAGRTAIIDVTITPSGPSGQTVTGDLYVDQLGELSSAAANAAAGCCCTSSMNRACSRRWTASPLCCSTSNAPDSSASACEPAPSRSWR